MAHQQHFEFDKSTIQGLFVMLRLSLFCLLLAVHTLAATNECGNLPLLTPASVAPATLTQFGIQLSNMASEVHPNGIFLVGHLTLLIPC